MEDTFWIPTCACRNHDPWAIHHSGWLRTQTNLSVLTLAFK
jgi:Sugar (and other) transporter